jgi:hypothetical protein
VLSLSLALSACHGATAGGLIPYMPFQVGGAAAANGGTLTVTTPQGWQVELDQAVIAVGPFYFNIQPPETGTEESGTVIIQATSQIIVDALDPTLYQVDAGANGETGHAVAVEIELCPPDLSQSFVNQSLLNASPGAGQSTVCDQGGSSAYISGTAQREIDGGVQVVPFDGYITIDQSLANASNPLPALQRVNGAGCDLNFTEAPQVLQARIDPTHWFDQIDFSQLIPPPPTCTPEMDGGTCDAGPAWSPDAGPLTWPTDSAFNSQLVTGLQSQTGVYLFDLQPQESR